MESVIVKLHFHTPVHFGKRRLSDSEMTLRADTLFSALYIEAVTLEMPTDFLMNDINISDTFPYIRDTYYLPKPLVKINNKSTSDDYKIYKKLKYIPITYYIDYIKGNIDSECATELVENFKIGHHNVNTKVNLRNIGEDGTGESEPYSIGTFNFEDNSGIYFMVNTDQKSLEKLEVLLKSLQYSGLGGKRFAGLGRFSYEIIPNELIKQDDSSSAVQVLLSTAMTTEEELSKIDSDNARFTLIKRSGFIQSTNFEEQLVKKRDFYSFNPGSVFTDRFNGSIFNVGENGTHPVYRYAKPFWLGVE